MLLRLTGDTWEGLHCERWQPRHAEHLSDLHLTESLLLLHERNGSSIKLRYQGTRSSFTIASGTFDYYPAGHYDELWGGPFAASAVLVRIPVRFEDLLLEQARRPPTIAPCFQFRDARLLRLVHSMLGEDKKGRYPDEPMMLSIVLVDRLHEIARSAQRPQQGFSVITRKLLEEYINQQLELRIDIPMIAHLTGLPQAQCERNFRNAFAVSLHKYVVSRRVDVAIDRLTSSAVPLAQLAHELGFSSQAHFSTVFRQMKGVTPGKYRECKLRSATK